MKLSPEARKQVKEKARLEGRVRLVRPLLVVFGLVFVVSVFVVRQSPEKQAPDEKDAKLHYDICKGKLDKPRNSMCCLT